MINAVNLYLESIIKAMPFVQRWGGLVRHLDRPVMDGATKLGTDIWPVTCDLDPADCFTNDTYKRLEPKEEYTSVFWFKEGGRMDLVRSNGDEHVYNFEIDLVGWLNLAKMGYAECSISQFCGLVFTRDLLKKFNPPGANAELSHTVLVVKRLRHMTGGHKEIFEPYSFRESQHLFVYPYEPIGVTISGDFYVKGDCVDNFAFKTEIECVESWNAPE